jgi:hypothetical protein
MANTTFTGPVISTNGFQGNTTGNVTGDVTGNVTGYIILPETDPEVEGALWNDNGTITVSAG